MVSTSRSLSWMSIFMIRIMIRLHKLLGIVLFLTILSILECSSAEVFYGLDHVEITGTAVSDNTGILSRLPDSLKSQVRTELWKLGRNTAGMALRFSTDATTISAKWTSSYKTAMNHMCPTGVRGLDLYTLQSDNTWAFVGSARPNLTDATSKSTFVSGLPKKMREYMLFLPLYDGIEDIQIGVESGAKFSKPIVDLPNKEGPIVMYGTSILQGGCATRPGMAHSNIIQRILNREVINLGFSGNGHLDLEIAKYMAQIPAALYIIDVLPNNTIKSLNQKFLPFYNILREENPDTPILLIESPYYPRCIIDPSYKASITKTNAKLKELYNILKASGDKNVYYFYGEDILDPEREGSIDGVHFTDVGFTCFADNLVPVLRSILDEQQKDDKNPTRIFLDLE